MSTINFNEVKKHFKQNKTPYYFVSATNFNLVNIHQWVNNWCDINNIDCFDGGSNTTLIPSEQPHPVFENVEKINRYLLEHPEIVERMDSDMKVLDKSERAKILFLFFNNELEKHCRDNKLDIILPPNDLVKGIDNKITTTEIGNEAKVYSVPNCLAKVDGYATLLELAQEHQLGHRWVVQTAFGDSGKTTFFISSEEEYDKFAEQIEEEDKVKIMKQIRCVGTAIEACATSQGTYVGPLLGEMIGFEALTPYQGGWCGNELYQDNFSAQQREVIHQHTERLGDRLYQRGYRGYFEVDYLLDLDDGSIYLGEINPRITGISAMTNMSPFCQKTMPLFLLHLLEYSETYIPFEPAAYNALSLQDGAQGTSSQMIIKSTDASLLKVVSAPVSGVYQLGVGGQLELVKASAEPTDKGDDSSQSYLLRIMNTDDYAYKGGDLAILFLNTKLTQNGGTELNQDANTWINAVHQAFETRELSAEERALINRFNKPSSIKTSED
ncbi:MAG: biotin carboxylase [Ghiorsea sp.]